MAPGAHDLILHDGIQEVARAVHAVVIDNPSSRSLRVEGWLTNLEPAVAGELKAGSTFPPASDYHQVVAIGPARPAQSRVRFSGLNADIPIEGRVERRAVVHAHGSVFR